MLHTRASGILLHPTSLPGTMGIGELGDAALEFVDFLVEAGQTRWQILPLGPTGYGDSPYASFSSFAGNPNLISLDRLIAAGDLEGSQVSVPARPSSERIDYGSLILWKYPLLRKAAETFLAHGDAIRRTQFEAFCHEEADWLSDYALFMALKEHFEAKAKREGLDCALWNHYWPRDIACRESEAVARWSAELSQAIAIQKVWQFYFATQWRAIKAYANGHGIQIIGDVPIFVAEDSADVWSAPDAFLLDDDRRPTVVAGVPPDYFSETGQRWGNPLYDWKAMQQDRFAWWVRRLHGTLKLVDIVRIDHFRGFESFWAIPANEETAVNGTWVKVPGAEFFSEVRSALGDLPVLAEDLGVITAKVDHLRESNGFPGMRILQFAFDANEDRSDIFLPHNYNANCVVYTGTHDNDSVRGWFDDCSDADRKAISRYLGRPVSNDDPTLAWEFIRLAMSSVARLAVFPMQDVLELGSSSRMNTPATQGSNWQWRMNSNYRESGAAQRLADMVEVYQRDDT